MSIIGKGTYKKRPASAFRSEAPVRIRMNTKREVKHERNTNLIDVKKIIFFG